VLSSALEAHRDNRRNSALRLKYLRAGEMIWHKSKLRTEWEDALDLGDGELWIQWLNWKATDPSIGMEGIVADARRALNAFHDSEKDQFIKCRIFWRMASLFKAMGFVERAMGLFQAQAELYV
jgi:hypothetical protein